MYSFATSIYVLKKLTNNSPRGSVKLNGHAVFEIIWRDSGSSYNQRQASSGNLQGIYVSVGTQCAMLKGVFGLTCRAGRDAALKIGATGRFIKAFILQDLHRIIVGLNACFAMANSHNALIFTYAWFNRVASKYLKAGMAMYYWYQVTLRFVITIWISGYDAKLLLFTHSDKKQVCDGGPWPIIINFTISFKLLYKSIHKLYTYSPK